jgi:hypothetical protein
MLREVASTFCVAQAISILKRAQVPDEEACERPFLVAAWIANERNWHGRNVMVSANLSENPGVRTFSCDFAGCRP